MTGRSSLPVRAVVAVAGTAVATTCWAAALLGGTVALRACATAWTLLALLAARHVLRPERAAAPTRDRRRVPQSPAGNPRLRQLQVVVAWAAHDRRYYERVFVPLVEQLGVDAEDPAAADALGEQVAAQLARTERRGHRWI